VPFPNPSSQFKPGQSGNPTGRPPGSRSIKTRLRELLERTELGGRQLPDGKQIADLVTEEIAKGALKGDFRFLQFIVENVERSNEIEAIWDTLESLGRPAADLDGDRTAGAEPPAGPVEPDPV